MITHHASITGSNVTEDNFGTYIDELNLPDLLHQFHGGVAIDEERLGVVSQLE